jgi:GT2 family glycosyltransferase
MDFAPVLLFVYNRPEHTKSVISSLLKNEIASQTPLIVYSDAAHEQSDEENVSRTRDIVRRISGFASVDIIERDTNYGLANNIIDGVTTQINKYGCVIVLEDDLVVSPYFLAFMNDVIEVI